MTCRPAPHAPADIGRCGGFPNRQRAHRCRLRLAKEVGSMQIMWMVTITLALALSGVLALALVAHIAARANRR